MKILQIPKILLPKNNIDYKKWAVVACDQFTSQHDYWDEVSSVVKGSYSSLNLILPEIYLNDNRESRLDTINVTMQQYINDDIFDTYNDLILVERTGNNGLVRIGLMIAVDLDSYDFTPGNRNYIKATEATVPERLPVRVEIRDNAIIELPHIMLLMDDREKKIIEPIYKNRENLEKLYDFDLNMNGGHLRGYKINKSKEIIDKLYTLIDRNTLIEKYNSDNPFLFAVGDGNHSLAAAKKCWEKNKATMTADEIEKSPLKYALCELVNIHCEGLMFEPIHRVIFNATEDFIFGMQNKFKGNSSIKAYYNEVEYAITVNDNSTVAIAEITQYIDNYLENNSNASIDYIHGKEYTLEVAKKNNGIALLLPEIKKEDLFSYVINYGILPRKAFSMGEAEDKRYYFEARIIK